MITDHILNLFYHFVTITWSEKSTVLHTPSSNTMKLSVLYFALFFWLTMVEAERCARNEVKKHPIILTIYLQLNYFEIKLVKIVDIHSFHI